MPIKNATKNAVISSNFKLCEDNCSKFKGLMFSKKQDKALIFKFNKAHKISLHMFFVFYPIDVLFLDKDKIVVDKKESFMPFRFYKSRRKAVYAIELPIESIRKTGTKIGDKIKF